MNQSNSGAQENESQNRRWELFEEHKKEAWNDIQSSTKSFEQSLLAVSSGGLGVSLAFIKDIVPLKQAVWLKLLYASWICFALCIALTVFSSPLGMAAQQKHLDYLWKFYIEDKKEFFNKKSGYSSALAFSTWLASIVFLAGLLCTVIFCIKNVVR